MPFLTVEDGKFEGRIMFFGYNFGDDISAPIDSMYSISLDGCKVYEVSGGGEQFQKIPKWHFSVKYKDAIFI